MPTDGSRKEQTIKKHVNNLQFPPEGNTLQMGYKQSRICTPLLAVEVKKEKRKGKKYNNNNLTAYGFPGREVRTKDWEK